MSACFLVFLGDVYKQDYNTKLSISPLSGHSFLVGTWLSGGLISLIKVAFANFSPDKLLTYSSIKRDQLYVTCVFISLFNAQHVSDVNTSILRSLRLIFWVISWVLLLCKGKVLTLACLFSGECLVVMCVVVWDSVFVWMLVGAVSYGYWVFFVCGMFLVMFCEHILMSCLLTDVCKVEVEWRVKLSVRHWE